MNKLVELLRKNMITIGVWAAIVIIISIVVSQNRARQAQYEANILNPQACDSTVQTLMQNGSLVDVLSSSEDPNGDSDSPINKRSVQIRETAAQAVDRIVAASKVSQDAELNTLFGLHKDADSKVKDAATAGLATFGAQSDAKLVALTNHLKDGDPDVRSAVTDGLGKIGGDKVAKLAAALIKDPVAQDSVLTILGGLGKTAVPYVEAHLDDPDVTFRQKMVNLLGKLGDPSTIPSLIATTQAKLPAIRRVAIIALTQIVQATESAKDKDGKPSASPGDLALAKSAEPTLIAVVNNPADDSDVRSQAALTLGYTASPAAVNGLVATLGDFDARVAQSALTGVETAGSVAVDPLIKDLGTGDSRSRAAAAQALGAIQTPQALAALQSVMSNSSIDPDIRRAGARGLGLGNTPNPTVVNMLVAALGDKNGLVADAASTSLLNPSFANTAVPVLVAAFQQPAPRPFLASQTLVHMTGESRPAVVAALQSALNSSNAQAQTWAAVTIGESDIKDAPVVAKLNSLASSGSTPTVKWVASQAAEQLQGTAS
jgi:HEAT repeat protein